MSFAKIAMSAIIIGAGGAAILSADPDLLGGPADPTPIDIRAEAPPTGAAGGLRDALNGALAALTQPSPDAPADSRATFHRVERHDGIGVELSGVDGTLVVSTVHDGSPAAGAGLRPGDRLTHLNGARLTGLTVEEALSAIRGPAGTELDLTFLRLPAESARTVHLIRAPIEVKTEMTGAEADDAMRRMREMIKQLEPATR